MDKIVFISGKGNPITTCLLVAEYFEKEHKHVLVTLRNLMADIPTVKLNPNDYYHLTSYEARGRQFPIYLMTRDGFYLLSMRLRGKRALEFQINFLNEFKRLEIQLKTALQNKAEFADRITASEDTVDLSQAVKLLQLPFGRNTFLKELRAKGIFFNTRNEPKQQYINHGYFHFSEVPIDVNGKTYVKTKTTITQKGLEWLGRIFHHNQSTYLVPFKKQLQTA